MNEQFSNYSVQISTPDQFTYPEDKLGSPDHTWHGVAVMWHDSLNSNVNSIANCHDRFTGIKVNLQGHSILAISLYLPTSGKDDQFLTCLAELSIYIRENTFDTKAVVIGTDSDCSEKSSPRRVQALHQFCQDHSLIKICYPGPTFHHNNGISTSSIDYFLVSQCQDIKLQDITIQCNQDFPQNLSSHDPVLCSLVTPSTEQAPKHEKYSHTYTDFKKSCLVWNKDNLPKYQAMAGKLLSECDSYFPTPDFIPLKCQLYSDLLVRASEISLDTRPNSKVKKHQYRQKIHQAWQHLQKVYKIWKKAGKPRDLDSLDYKTFRQARAAFQQIRRHSENLKVIKLNNKLINTYKNERNKHLSLIQNIRGYKSRQRLTVLHTPSGDYFGNDILEGFANDAELLGKSVEEAPQYDNHFYRLCIQDNHFIFDFKTENSMKIPKMSMEDLSTIVNKEMKRGKASDIYKLTAEHLKNAGDKAMKAVLNLINDIIENIEYLACPQIKVGLSTAVFKGKRKPVSKSSSYRRITVTPQIGSILDRFVDPIA